MTRYQQYWLNKAGWAIVHCYCICHICDTRLKTIRYNPRRLPVILPAQGVSTTERLLELAK